MARGCGIGRERGGSEAARKRAPRVVRPEEVLGGGGRGESCKAFWDNGLEVGFISGKRTRGVKEVNHAIDT